MARQKRGETDGAALVGASSIVATVAVENPAVAGSNLKPGSTVQTKQISANLDQEYVSGGGYVWLATYIKALPFWIDDLTRDLGDDIYERMGRDPQVSSSVSILKDAILANEWQIAAAEVDDEATRTKVRMGETQPSADQVKANEIADFVKRSLNGMEESLTIVLREMLDAISRGYRIAEIVYRIPNAGVDKGKLVLRAIKPKPRTAAAFVVDVYYNVLGIIGIIPGQGAPIVIQSILGSPDQMPNLLPRRKFCVCTWLKDGVDPRGNSQIRSAYNGWWTKMQLWGEYLKYVARFASPGIHGETPPDATSRVANGVAVSPETDMFNALTVYQNGGIAVTASGAKVNLLEATGNGEAFLNGIELSDSQIAKAILFQTLATGEGKHQARAASETHQDILGLPIGYGKRVVESMVTHDVISGLVEYNFGLENAHLAPAFSLGKTEQQDVAALMTAIGTLFGSGYVHVSQLPGLDQLAGLPARDMQAQLKKMADDAIAAKEVACATAAAATQQGARTAGKREAGDLEADDPE